jgi:hypothetical protein
LDLPDKRFLQEDLKNSRPNQRISRMARMGPIPSKVPEISVKLV